jgi:c-di-GMP-binding flagellar brake protein YcgR
MRAELKSAIVSATPKKTFSWKPLQLSDRRPSLRLTASGRRWDVRLVGLISRTRFLVTHPMDEGKLVFVKEGDYFDVANFDGAVLSGFESAVLRVVLGEAPGLELSLPALESRRREVIRRARRVRLGMPCSIRYGEGEGQLRAGFTGDLSEQGAQVAIERPLPAGIEEVDLSLRIVSLGATQTVQIRSVVRSQSADPRPDIIATLLGLQFVAIDPALQLVVSQFVGERLLAEADDVFGAIR